MRGSQRDPFPAERGPENIRLLAVSKTGITDHVVVSQPKVAHGTGSKDADNSIVLGGADYQSSLVVFPHPMQVHRSSHPVIIGLSHANIFSGEKITSSRMT